MAASALTAHVVTILVIWKNTYAIVRLSSVIDQRRSIHSLLLRDGMLSLLLFHEELILTYSQGRYSLGRVLYCCTFTHVLLILTNRAMLIVDLAQTITSKVLFIVRDTQLPDGQGNSLTCM